MKTFIKSPWVAIMLLFVPLQIKAVNYIPQVTEVVTKDTTIYSSDITSGGNHETSWISVPDYVLYVSSIYTPLATDDSNGNPQGIVDNITSPSSVGLLTIKNDAGVYNAKKRGIHFRVSGARGIIIHAFSSGKNRGMAIGYNEITSALINDDNPTTLPIEGYSMTRPDKAGPCILQYMGFSPEKEYVVSIYSVGGDSRFYAAELIAGTFPPNPFLIKTSGNTDQTRYQRQPISDIMYQYAGSATSASVTWTGTSGGANTPPEGITVVSDNQVKTLTIAGRPTEAGTFEYSVTSSDGTNASNQLTGTITVLEAPINPPVEPLVISMFRVDGGRTAEVNQSGNTVSIILDPSMINSSNVGTCTFASAMKDGYTITPDITQPQDFSSPVTYSVEGLKDVHELGADTIIRGTFTVTATTENMILSTLPYSSDFTENIVNEFTTPESLLPYWITLPDGVSDPGGSFQDREQPSPEASTDPDFKGGYIKIHQMVFNMSSCGTFTFKWASAGSRYPELTDQTGKVWLTYPSNRSSKNLYTESVVINSSTPITLTLSFYTGAAVPNTAGVYHVSVTDLPTNINIPIIEKEVLCKEYYDLTGKRIQKGVPGFVIEKIIFVDGSNQYKKVFINK